MNSDHPSQPGNPSGASPFRRRVASVPASAFVLALAVVVRLSGCGGSGPALETEPFTDYAGREVLPAISPDGTRVVFSWDGEKGGQYDLYMKQVGSEPPLRLTDDPGNDGYPAWSPDGETIAFVGSRSDVQGIYTVPAGGGAGKKLIDVPLLVFGLDWSPDGRTIAYSTRDERGAPRSLHLLSLDDLTTRQITSPAAGEAGDRSPAYSPDGKTIAFARGATRDDEDIYVMPAAGGDPRRVTRIDEDLKGFDWTRDGRHFVVAAGPDPAGEYRLWRAALSGGGLSWLPTGGKRVSRPSVARAADRMVYEEQVFECRVMRLPVAGELGEEELITSTGADFAAVYSPDGDRIAFLSTRSGRHEVWVCDAGGKDARRLTSFDGAFVGAPIWSHDGKRIAFDATDGEGNAIGTIDADGGDVRTVARSSASGRGLAWSAGDDAVYYRTDRRGTWELRRIGLDGNGDRSVLEGDVRRAAESSDGRWLYYSLSGSKGIRRVPAAGGDTETLLDAFSLIYPSHWRLVDGGIYLFKQNPRGMLVCYYDIGERRLSNLGRTIHLPGYTVDVSPDGGWLIYDRIGRVESDLTLVEGIR